MKQHIAHIIKNKASQRGNREALRFKYRNDKQYTSISWTQFIEETEKVSRALISYGLGHADNIGIFSDNRPEWSISDIAILSIRAVVVPFYASSSRQQIKYMVDETQMKLIIVGNEAQLENAIWALNNCESLEKLVIIENIKLPEDSRIIGWKEFCKLGENETCAQQLAKLMNEAENSDLATIVYTSGTTGEPKGVMLGHDNFSSCYEIHDLRLDVTEADVSMCFLPLSHIYERSWTFYMLYRGVTNVYLENPRTIIEALPEVKPSLICVVPRFLEKTHEGIMAEKAKWSKFKNIVFDWAIKIGGKVSEYRKDSKPTPFFLGIKRAIANKLVLQKLRNIFGGNIRVMPCAGAAINSDLLRFFHATGMFINFGYGATETTATVSCFKSDVYDFNTCGTKMPNVDVKISDEGEIMVKARTVFRGYYKKAEATAKVLIDGWYKTGDNGALKNGENLVMLDRLDDLFKTSGGKFVSPQKIELVLGQDQHIQQVVIIGEKRNFVTALIVPSFENLRIIADRIGLKNLNDETLILQKEIINYMNELIERIQLDLAPYERVRKFCLLPEPFNIESNTLTPSLKVRRKVVMEKYKEIIDRMYFTNQS